MHNGWNGAKDLTLTGKSAEQWSRFTSRLPISFVGLRDDDDSLVWSWEPNGNYSASIGNKAMFLAEEQESEWWWKPLWKVKAPLKSRIYFVGIKL